MKNFGNVALKMGVVNYAPTHFGIHLKKLKPAYFRKLYVLQGKIIVNTKAKHYFHQQWEHRGPRNMQFLRYFAL